MIARIKKILFIPFIILILGNNAKCNHGKNDITSYYGTWTVKKHRGGTAVGTFDDAQASKYINKQVLLMSEKAIIFGDECSAPLYKERKEIASDYLYNGYNERDFSIITIDTATIVDLTCSSNPIYNNPDSLNFIFDFILLNDREMIMPVGGVYLYLEKEKVKERELTFKEYNGTGDFKEKIDLNSCNTAIKIEYNFYNIADRIILEDANGNIFFSTEMETTNGIKSITKDVKLTAREQCYLYLKVESSQKEKSKWKLKVTLSEY